MDGIGHIEACGSRLPLPQAWDEQREGLGLTDGDVWS